MTGIRSLTITMALCMAAASAFASVRELLSLPVAAPLRANTQMGDFRTSPQPFPDEHGRIVLKARLRTVGGIAKMNIHLIGDGYAWRHSREIEVAEVPQTFTVEGEMPRSITKKNEFVVRLDPPATPVFVESVSVSWLPVQTAPSDGREKLVNADFVGGAWGYMRYVPAASTDSRVRRAVVSGGRARPYNICFRSFSYPIVHGRDYTVAARVRSLDQSSPAEVSLMMIDNAWHIKRKVQTLSDGDWHDIRFSCRMERSTYNRGYVRVDAKGPGIEIDRMSLAEGVLEGYPPFIDGEILPGGQTLFDAGNPAEFLLRRRNVSGKPGKTKIRIRDARGGVVRQIDFAYGSEPVSNLGIAIPAYHPKGLFEVEAPGVPRIRYAVAENLASRRFSFNPYGGHYHLNDSKDLSWYRRYVPIACGANRAFCRSTCLPRDAAYLSAVDSLGVDSILVMPDFKTFTSDGECPWTDDVKRDYLSQTVEMARCFVGHRVLGVELFNEPHLWRLRTGPEAGRGTMSGSKVAQIHAEAVPLIRRANPGLKVFGPCCSLKGIGYLEDFLKSGGGAFVDGISVHCYMADPDVDDVAGLYRDLRAAVVRNAGHELPVLNTESYFGVRNSPCVLSDNEAQRSYFRDSEWSHAGVVAAQLANHAAAQVTWCNFAPESVISGLVESPSPYPFAAMPALNAGIAFLADCGGGREVPLKPGLRAFLFPSASGGPLATLRSRIDVPVRVEGLSGIEVYDMFGNKVSRVALTLHDEIAYLRFRTEEEAEDRLRKLRFSGLDAYADRERPLEVGTVCATYSKDLSLGEAKSLRLADKNLSRVFTPGVVWKGEADLSAAVRIVWNETGLKLGVVVRDDRAVYPESAKTAYRADSLQVYFDQRNDATPASEEAGRRREDDIIYNIAALDGGRSPVAYVSFANGSRYLGAANETTGIDDEVKVSYARNGDCHVYKVFFPASAFPDFKLTAGAKIGFSLAVNDADEPGRRGQSLVLSSPGVEPYLHAHEYLDLEFSGCR